jgi:hypothetical protein
MCTLAPEESRNESGLLRLFRVDKISAEVGNAFSKTLPDFLYHFQHRFLNSSLRAKNVIGV